MQNPFKNRGEYSGSRELVTPTISVEEGVRRFKEARLPVHSKKIAINPESGRACIIGVTGACAEIIDPADIDAVKKIYHLPKDLRRDLDDDDMEDNFDASASMFHDIRCIGDGGVIVSLGLSEYYLTEPGQVVKPPLVRPPDNVIVREIDNLEGIDLKHAEWAFSSPRKVVVSRFREGRQHDPQELAPRSLDYGKELYGDIVSRIVDYSKKFPVRHTEENDELILTLPVVLENADTDTIVELSLQQERREENTHLVFNVYKGGRLTDEGFSLAKTVEAETFLIPANPLEDERVDSAPYAKNLQAAHTRIEAYFHKLDKRQFAWPEL